MFKNYLKTAFRNLTRNRAFSALNMAGLAIGMASAILILLWIQNEMSFDRFHDKLNRLYLMASRDKFDGKMQTWNSTPKPLAPALIQQIPEVENATRFMNITFLVSAGEKHLNLRGAFTDPSFLHMFSFPAAEGNLKNVLTGTSDIVITNQLAVKLFGNEEAIGKTIKIDSTENFRVVAVLKNLPNNTSFEFEYLLPWTFLKRLGWDDDSWGNSSISTYALLKPGVTQSQFDANVRTVIQKHSDESLEVFSQPVSKMHLYGRSDNGNFVAGKIEIVRLFLVIAGFILLIACINFMNLSTARSEKRAREVGVRKVAGARKSMLVIQFMGESLMMAFFAGVLALFLVQISLPAFGDLIGKQLHLDFANPSYWTAAILFILFTGLLAGSYPALFLSSFDPVKVLKGTFKSPGSLVKPRQVLVVIQFGFAIALIICTIIVKQEIDFARSRDSGYSRNNLIYTYTQGDANKNFELIKRELLSGGAALSVTKSANPITQRWGGGYGYKWPGSTEINKKQFFVRLGSDANFIKTMGARLVAGRDIDVYNYPGDTTAMLLNESAVNAMGLKDPVGQIVERDDDHQWKVVGVVKDFVLESPFEEKVNPMMIIGPSFFFQVIHIKLNPANAASVNIEKAGEIFKKYNPEYPFDYVFTDEAYARKFRDEKRTGTLAGLFAGLSILISCLGLFGLATYMAENRIKEIGVRKVLGASVPGIVALLSKDFVKLVLVSFLIAAPVAWFAMNEWLQGYSYRVELNAWVFLATGFLSLFIALLTVSYQALKAAVSNPARSLRAE